MAPRKSYWPRHLTHSIDHGGGAPLFTADRQTENTVLPAPPRNFISCRQIALCPLISSRRREVKPKSAIGTETSAFSVILNSNKVFCSLHLTLFGSQKFLHKMGQKVLEGAGRSLGSLSQEPVTVYSKTGDLLSAIKTRTFVSVVW